ncbi:hypothetical protein WI77_26260 [Burkholderia ubonensis]|uniref:hypothetical protein n=1 Tax=Burkholderia ubonensis TaxID=101571 RepID=UPI00076D76B8|nr:hypothetical protein [Burkholderia ubonensis]KVD06622.1 hypothetical protein WI77_26260 [Burkholderia ubonensis]
MKLLTLYRCLPALVALTAVGAPLADANAQPSFPRRVEPAEHDQYHPLPIAPPARHQCDVSIGQGRVEYGQYSAGELRQVGKRRLTFGQRTLPLAVTCPAPATLSISLRGRANTHGNLAFGTLGITRLTLGDATLDGRKVQFQTNAEMSLPVDAITLSVGHPVMIAVAPGTVARGKTLLATLTIESMIPVGSTKFADLTDLSSDAVIEVTEH